MENREKLIKAVEGLAELLAEKETEIYILKNDKEFREKEIAELKKRETKDFEKDMYIKTLEAKVYDLEERLAIVLGDNEGPMPMCEEFPKAGDVTEVVNVTKVIEGVVE
jgi:hypothetical protein